MKVRYILAISLLALTAGCSREATEERQPATPAPAGADAAQAEAERISAATRTIDDARIRNANSEPGNWLSTGRTYDEQRFSPLD